MLTNSLWEWIALSVTGAIWEIYPRDKPSNYERRWNKRNRVNDEEQNPNPAIITPTGTIETLTYLQQESQQR